MSSAASDNLEGRIIGVTAERRSHQQARFLEARGATVICAAAMHTKHRTDEFELLEATERFIALQPNILIVQTGQGLQWWLDCAREAGWGISLADALRHVEVWTRGPKASSAARRADLQVAWQAPREVVADLIDRVGAQDLTGSKIVLQLDGNSASELPGAVRDAGAELLELDVYRYALPTDRTAASALIDQVIEGTVDAVTFTSSPAIRHFREIADLHGALEDLDNAFKTSTLAAVVGPVCNQTAREAGWTLIAEPPQARLIPMLETLTGLLQNESL